MHLLAVAYSNGSTNADHRMGMVEPIGSLMMPRRGSMANKIVAISKLGAHSTTAASQEGLMNYSFGP